MAECTPSCDEVRRKYVVARPAFRAAEDAEAEFDRFLARVRRDAAREALDGLLRQYPYGAVMFLMVEDYRDTHYPETED